MFRNCIKKFVIFIGLFSFCVPSFFAKEIVFGGKNGWKDLEYTYNVTTGSGRFGYDCLELATNSFEKDDYTDLIIDFEDSKNCVSEGNYKVVSNSLQICDNAIMEKSAGLSRNIGGLSLLGNRNSLFGNEGLIGSFCIEFWLCPSVSENGEVIFNWESAKNVEGKLIYQLLNGIMNNGHLEWNFSNIFDYYTRKNGLSELKLTGKSILIPDSWSYHAISFDCESGILEYLVNGITEDIQYVTSTGDESGEVFLAILGTPSQVDFCSDYTGKIDDIRILRRPYSAPDYQSSENAGLKNRVLYSPDGGRFETKPIMLSKGSSLNSLRAEFNTPEQTDVRFYVRSGDNYFNWTADYPEWKPVESDEQIDDVSGLYFQVAVDLYPDGNGEKTPSVTQITLDYSELPLPLPPMYVKAVAGNGQVTLNWSYSVDETTGGYYIFYGNRPGEYLGRIALEGESPINVGEVNSFTLTGLQNGKIYYFAVAAWSSKNDEIIGDLSKEVFARPLSSRQ